MRTWYEVCNRGKLINPRYVFESEKIATNIALEVARTKGQDWMRKNKLEILTRVDIPTINKRNSESKIMQKDGVTYVTVAKKLDGKTALHIKSRWLSKNVYIALKESGLYFEFMGAVTLKEATDVLNKKQGGIKKRR